MANMAGKASGLRWNEITKWADRAVAMDRQDIADVLFLERMDVCQDAAETAALINRVRAALLLEAFTK